MQEEKDLVYYIRKYIFAITQNFKSTLKKISFTDLQEMLQDLDEMLTEYYKQEPEKCSKLARISYLPIIKKMFDIDRTDTYKGNYQQYMRNAYRMSAYSSLEHYMVYREWDETDKFYLPRIAIMQGYIHYLQELVNPESKVRLVVCNMPSGYGKTFPEKISEAWAFGRDPTGTILSLCSNVDVVRGGSRTVINEIKSEAFGNVFLKMKYTEEDKKYFLKETEDNWKLRDCKLVASYYANTVNSNVVGIRASQRIHIDDLYADYKEAMNQSTNELFFNRFLTVWRKRFVQNKEPRIVVTGTLWASGDFIAQIIDLEERDHVFVPDSMYKFTRVSQDGSVVIIQVPALDYETGLSTCPELRTTQEILKEKEAMDEYLFETNFQQRPVDPESLEFSYKVLRTYRELPKKQEYEAGAYSVIDATRKSGKDFFAMPIHRKILTEDGSYDFPLVDCIFTKKATKDLYLDVVNKIIEHHIVLLIIESNVTSELKQNLEQILDQYQIYYCEIREKYNTIPKETRIDMEKSVIRRKILYPVRELYPLKSDMGLFMDNMTLYNASGRNINDDAPDSEAMFASEIIEEGSKPQRITVLKRPF